MAATAIPLSIRSASKVHLAEAVAEIAARARFILERSHRDNHQETSTSVSANVESFSIPETINAKSFEDRLARWCQVVAQGDRTRFEKRLQWDGWDLDTARTLLQPQAPSSQSLPAWAKTLQSIIRMAKSGADDSHDAHGIPWRDADRPMPFEEIWLPVIRVARQALFARLKGSKLPSAVSLVAYQGLESGLRRRLINVCAQTLDEEFTKSRPIGSRLLNRLSSDAAFVSTHHYQAFVNALLSDGLLRFFQTYPVQGRFIASVVDDSVEAISEFLQRLESDLPLIELQFSPHRSLGALTEIRPLLSDVHHHGRSVIALTFDSGIKLIYKPRDMGLEVAYNQFLGWCNHMSQGITLQTLTIISRANYGWVEYVEQLPCEDSAAAHRFYQRSGNLLCLLYSLEATDCHNENLIACGEHPVLVDAEAIMHPRARSMTELAEPHAGNEVHPGLSETTYDYFEDSVLRTGLLPRWNIESHSQIPYDISGLGGNESQQTPRSHLRWKAINTDQMQLIHERIIPPVEAHVPMFDGQALSPMDYLEDLVIGFRQMYQLLMLHRDELLSPSSILSKFQGQRSRFIFRPTRVYGMVLFNSLSPQHLRDGMDYSIELDALSRAYLFALEKPLAWSIMRAERAAMERLDIPYFSASVRSDALSDHLDTPLSRYFEQSGYSQVLSRLQRLSDQDLARQTALLRGTFHASGVRTHSSMPSESFQRSSTNTPTRLSEPVGEPSGVSTERLLNEAEVIASIIRRSAIRESDSSIHWIGLNRIPRTDRFQFEPLGFNLYDGKSGIVLFLAALDEVRHTHHFRDLILGAVQPLRYEFARDRQTLRQWVQRNDHGGGSGLGSILYAWMHLSRFLSEPLMLEEAERVVDGMSVDWIAADRHLDVLSGVAGTLLGILALYRETQNKAVLSMAIACGQHVLDQQVSVDGAPKAWITLDRKPLTGFSHGAAGIAYALLQLYAVTDDADFLTAATEAIEYERTAFTPSECNWIDFRGYDARGEQPGYTMSWCHGAPGIALARLGGLSILSTPEIRQEIDIALHKMITTPFQPVDFPCCGNLGLAEVLLVASKKLNRPELLVAAQQRVELTLEKARASNGFQLHNRRPTSDFSLGFFQGIAGIGYELLRFAFPDQLRSILLWE